MIKALKVDQNTQCHTIMISLKKQNFRVLYANRRSSESGTQQPGGGGGCHSKEFFFNLHIKSELSRSGHPLRFWDHVKN